FLHGLDAEGKSGMDVEHRACLAGSLVERPESVIGQRDAIDVAEYHASFEPERADPVEFPDRRGGIVEGQGSERAEALPPLGYDRGKRVVDQTCELSRTLSA